MSVGRIGIVVRQEISHHFRSPLIWALILLLILMQWALATSGPSSGNPSAGIAVTWSTGVFAVSRYLCAYLFLGYLFVPAFAAGTTIVRDDELKVGEVLRSTPLSENEYIVGKFGGALMTFLLILTVHLASMIVRYHVLPMQGLESFMGPFHLGNYLLPALVFALPAIIFVIGTALAIGVVVRQPTLVFGLCVALWVLAQLLGNWSPTWLSPQANGLLMLLEPTGFRWVNETWFKVDRGAEFYNTQPMTFGGTFGAAFLLSRLAFILIGVGSVVWCTRRFKRTVRGAHHGRVVVRGEEASPVPVSDPGPESGAIIPPMTCRPLGFLRGLATVARFEIVSIRTQYGVYLIAIIMATLAFFLAGNQYGGLDSRVFPTSGLLTMSAKPLLVLIMGILLLIHTIETQYREQASKLTQIFHTTAISNTSIIFGKMASNVAAGTVVVLAAVMGSVIGQVSQGWFHIEFWPYLLVWGVLLLPTYLFWGALFSLIMFISRSRNVTVCVGFVVVILNAAFRSFGWVNWVNNWNIDVVTRWSDISMFELDRNAILLNRIELLGLAVLFIAISVVFYRRQDRDVVGIVQRLRPKPLLKLAVYLLPFLIVPAVSGVVLWREIKTGREGDRHTQVMKSYWVQNIATYFNALLPTMISMDLDLKLDPAQRWFKVSGTYTLKNLHDEPLKQIPLTGDLHWENMAWTINGEPYEPEDRSLLFVFTPPEPMQSDDTITIGFSHEGYFLDDISRNGGQSLEFIMPSGVMLSSRTTNFLPMLGFVAGRGVTSENRFAPRVRPDDYYKGEVRASSRYQLPFTTDARISGPADFTYNAPGALVRDEVVGDIRTMQWRTEFPVRMFNVVAGRWNVKEGNGTKIFYHPEHHYNIEEMSQSLDAALKYFSEWFMEYPWPELKLSQFPNIAGNATGYPSNITFSEGIGFLIKADPRSNAAFNVTAHEASHQWWGNLLQPGSGPGAASLGEGMAQFSTILLVDQVKGLRDRIEFCKRIESKYANARRVDAERPMVRTDGTRRGDRDVLYNKGGWVFWMLLNHMGRENALAGCREFISQYHITDDFPVLQDFVATMRPFAPDEAAFDAFTNQWFFEVVMPEYRLHDVKVSQIDAETWEVTARLENLGTGRMPLEVAVMSGERFAEDGSLGEDYLEARQTIIVDAGESGEIVIRTPFEPQRMLVDPDALVLQLNRGFAAHKF